MTVLNDNSKPAKLRDWIKTTRIQTAMVTALALWIGYISVQPISVEVVILLGLVGLSVHIWGFTLNEVEDYKYDKEHGEGKGHPIAQGRVHAGAARTLAWIAAVVSLALILLGTHNIGATAFLAASFVPGYMYDKFSKRHWWSNIYLSIWALLMVVTGAIVAGIPTWRTGALALAVSIQIFVQVIQGDLKDFNGPEASFSKRCGVTLQKLRTKINSGGMTTAGDHQVFQYSRTFIAIVYGLKLLELALVMLVVVATIGATGMIESLWIGVMVILTTAFIATLSMFMAYVNDRDKIKTWSSAHELVSVLLLAGAVFQIDQMGALFLAVVPAAWYILTNSLIHTSALNPDI